MQWIITSDSVSFDACDARFPGDLLAAQLCTERVFDAWARQLPRLGTRAGREIRAQTVAAGREAEGETDSDVRRDGDAWRAHADELDRYERSH
jgi:hypothetical protein